MKSITEHLDEIETWEIGLFTYGKTKTDDSFTVVKKSDFDLLKKENEEIKALNADFIEQMNENTKEHNSMVNYYCSHIKKLEDSRDYAIADNVTQKKKIEELEWENKKLKENVAWNLQNNDEFGCEFLGITIVRDQNRFLTERIDYLREALENLLNDTQHANHNCGDKNCPVDLAREAIEILNGGKE